MLIYKIMTASQWSTFQKSGQFTGAPVDLADGFIHFSTAAQMRETAAKHFAGANDLVLVWGEDGPLGAELKWEVSRGGAKFPHLFRDWQLSEVTDHAPLPLIDGAHRFPDGHA